MPMTIDGLIEIGNVTLTNVGLTAGDAVIGRVKVVDETGLGLAASVQNQELAVASEAIAGSSTATSGSSPGNTSSFSIRPAVVAPNRRKYITISNPETLDPTNVLWIGAGSAAIGSGIPLYPGETFEDDESQAAWYGIFVTAGLNVPWYEVTSP